MADSIAARVVRFFRSLAELDTAAEPEAAARIVERAEAQSRANQDFDRHGPDERDRLPGGRADHYSELFRGRGP